MAVPLIVNAESSDVAEVKKKRMSTWDLICLAVAMGGSQIMWTMELGWGNPYLLSLGLSESLTSLVWLAGPISGLVAQPVIGAISDSSTSKYRRRYWITLSTAVLVFSSLILAYTTSIAALLVDFIRKHPDPWDPRRIKSIKNTAIGIAIACFYLMDFALNALQASLRNLLLDVTPAEQLSTANAWHGRMTHAGNIIGFLMGFANLAGWPLLSWIGGDQFRKVCIVCVSIMVVTAWVTVSTQEEQEGQKDPMDRGSSTKTVIANVLRTIRTLPRPVRRVCYVQIFAFMGWFPFLFYSTTWVGEIMAKELNQEPDVDKATRAGAFAMFWYSIVAVIAGTLLPYLASRDNRLLKETDDESPDVEIVRIRETVRQWKAEAAREGRQLQLPVMPFMLRNIWTGALLLFSVVMMSTFFITTVWQASIAISIVGICWAVAVWAPFSIIMEFLKEMDESAAAERRRRTHTRRETAASASRPLHSRTASTPSQLWKLGEESDPRTPLLRRRSLIAESEEAGRELGEVGAAPVAGGTILGIHNLAIVVPQLLISIIASIIFRMVDGGSPSDPNEPEYIYYGKNGVSWIMRFGGFCALFGALLSRRVPPTKTERQMRLRLAEMREAEEQPTP
jgi:solute carrier family 45 protein 1/2/4